MTRALFVAFSLLLTTSFACGDKDDEQEENTYKCSEDDSVRCDRDTEFCLRTYEGDVQKTAECPAIPDGCEDGCDCLTEADIVTETCGFLALCTEINDTNPRVDCEPTEEM